MSPAECRREAHRLLRDASVATVPALAEAERLFRLAEAEDARAVELRRSERLELQRVLEPELYSGCQCQ